MADGRNGGAEGGGRPLHFSKKDISKVVYVVQEDFLG